MHVTNDADYNDYGIVFFSNFAYLAHCDMCPRGIKGAIGQFWADGCTRLQNVYLPSAK